MTAMHELVESIQQVLIASLTQINRKAHTIQSENNWKSLYRLYDKDIKVEGSESFNIQDNLLIFPFPNLSFFYQLEITDFDMLLIDSTSGSIGLIKQLRCANNKEQLDAAIDVANYLRHLIISYKMKFHVELVLVIPQKTNDSEQTSQANVLDYLNELMLETNYLHALGISILHFYPNAEKPFEDTDFDKCFAWLLLRYQNWMKKDESHTSAEYDLIKEIHLKNYRCWINHAVEFNQEHQIHLIHGNNGAGKSTFSEALELLLTNDIKRFKQQNIDNYADILKNNNTQVQEIHMNLKSLRCDDGKAMCKGVIERKYQLSEENKWQQTTNQPNLKPLHSAYNFRLDQPLINDLLEGEDSKRTISLLSAFFPEELSQRNIQQEKDKKLRSISTLLGLDEMRTLKNSTTDLDNEQVLNRLQCLQFDDWKLTAQDFFQLLGIRLEDIKTFSILEESIVDWIEQIESGELEINLDAIDQLDRGIAALRSKFPEIKGHLETARILLDEGADGVAGWHIKAEVTKEPSGVLLNNWLEAWIFTETNEQALKTANTLAKATLSNWQIPQDSNYLNHVKTDEESLSLLTAEVKKYKELHKTLEKKVAALWKKGDDKKRAIYKSTLSNNDIKALNYISDYLDLKIRGKLGDYLKAAMNQQTMDSSFLLLPGWATEHLEKVLSLNNALNVFGEERILNITRIPFKNQLTQYKNLLSELQELKKLEQKQKQTFFAKMTDLIAPLNELLSLSTSASWQYKTIQLKKKGTNGEETTSTTYGQTDHDATAILNTAELNLFTVCLFFLCAPRLENPYRLLLLDDPLQNMDELTVTTLARSLSKVFRLWRKTPHFKHWQVLFLFHGEDDLERFVQEVFAARYNLPWLNKQITIDDENRSLLKSENNQRDFDVNQHSFDINLLLPQLESLEYQK